MKSKTMILLAGTVLCALGAAYMTQKLLAERNQMVTVLVPKADVMPLTIIRDPAALFESREMKTSDTPRSRVVTMEDLKDRMVLRHLKAGEPVTNEDLQAKNMNMLEQRLKPEMKAYAIKADAPSTAGGFVWHGSHVDVIHARPGTDPKIILEDVLVVAVDTLTVKPDERTAMIPSTVTFEVTKEQVLILAKAKESGGTISLALLSQQSGERPKSRPAPVVEAPQETPASKDKDNDKVIMNLWLGNKHWVTTFEGGQLKTSLKNEEATRLSGPGGTTVAGAPAEPYKPPVQGK